MPALFERIRRDGELPPGEMWRVFNMGVGLVLAVDAQEVEAVLGGMEGGWRLGRVVERAEGAGAVAFAREAAGG